MLGLALSTIAVLILLALSAFSVYKGRTAANIAMAISAFLLAAIEGLDRLSLLLPDPLLYKWGAVFCESFLPATFLFFSITYSRKNASRSVSPVWWALFALSALFPATVFKFSLGDFFYAPDMQTEKMLFLGNVGYWFYMSLMVYCIAALMNLEATFSSTSGADRWRMKFEVIGLSGILAVLIFYFSQGLLYRTINMNLVTVRSGVFIIASFLVGYSKLLRGNGVRVAVSRYILYRSLTLLLVGVYLLALGLIGEGMKYFGVSFSRNIAIFIGFLSGIMMLVFLFSEQMRRRAKVIINKHFYAQKHDYRTEWLNFTERLALCRTGKDINDEILATYMNVFGLKGASLYLLSSQVKSYRLAANREMPSWAGELEVSREMNSYFTERSRVLNPHDGEYNPTEGEASFMRKSGAMLVVPLTANGSVDAVVVLGEQLAPEEFIYEDYDLMKTLAKQAALSIVNFRLSEELAETREITAVARISSFVIHDLKNLASTLSLLLDNAEDYIGDPEFQNDMIEATRNTLTKMKNLIQRLRTIPEKQTLNAVPADMLALVRDTVGEVLKSKPGAEIVCEGTSVNILVDAEEIKKVILNLILNAIDAIKKDGLVKVNTGVQEDRIFVRVSDNGCGMAEEFINNHLFKPFRTTKSKGLGIGLYQCKQIVEAHGGTIEVASIPGKGSEFTIILSSSMAVPNGKTVNY